MKVTAYALLAIVACIPPPPAPAPAPVTAQAGGGLGCIQVFECYAGCGEDMACMQACQGRADPAAQVAAAALVECGTRRY
jgi:hypothetical protein